MGLGLDALWVGGHLLSTPLSKKVPRGSDSREASRQGIINGHCLWRVNQGPE